MRYKLLGRSGLRVSELCFGAMTFGGGVGSLGVGGSDDAQSRAIFDRFAEAGGNFIDTACSYSGGRSEELLGDFCAADRDHFVIATKYTNSHSGGLMRSGNSRRNMMRSVEESLRRLKTDRIDLFWLHVWDHTTPIDEVMRGFDDLVSSGKVQYVGLSDTPAWEVSRANMMADLLGLTPLVAIQVEYSLLQRECDNDLLPMAKALDLGVTAWSPLSRGALAKGVSPATPRSPRDAAVVEVVKQVAAETGSSTAQVALTAIRQSSQFPGIIPIIGASSLAQLNENLGCLDLQLDEAQIAKLEAASNPTLVFPHSVTRTAMGEKLTTGGQVGLLDNHRR